MREFLNDEDEGADEEDSDHDYTMMMMMMMMIIMTLLGSSLLKAGVKDMGDLATLDSQSIRPIHPNLLHPDDDVGWG